MKLIKIKKEIMDFINGRIRYDWAERVFFLSRRHRKKIEQEILAYKSSLSDINGGKKNDKITIVYICQLPSLWNGVKTVFEAGEGSADVTSYIVAIPEKITGNGFDLEEELYGDNMSYEFCRKFCENTINGYDQKTKEFFDIETLNPTYVFLQRPYDNQLPEKYRSKSISKYAKVCYIPYAYCCTVLDSRLSYDLEFLCNVYAVFTENEYYAEILGNICKIYKCLPDKRIYNLGFPRFDLYKYGRGRNKNKYQKTILWLPRWTTDPKLEATTFFLYKDVLIKYFKSHKEFKLICRPHPLMLRNFVSCGLLTEAEKDDFLEVFRKVPNFEYDINGDYTTSFEAADIFISDYSSLLIEEVLNDKPILYTGNFKNFEKFTLKWTKGIYKVDSVDELIKELDDLVFEIDTLKEIRKEAREFILRNNDEAGAKIIATLVEDYKMTKQW